MPEARQALDTETGLHKQLTAGQMAMVAIGGSIGTGLLLGSGAAIQIAGPAVIITYLLAALVAFIVAMALGEMASVHPAAGSFGLYAELYLHPWAGFVARYGYWLSVVTAVGAELVAAATYARFWLPRVPALVWIMVFAALLLALNLRAVGAYGRVQYWLAMLKLVTIVIFIVTGAGLLLAGRVAPHYTNRGGWLPHGPASPFLALSFALFSFLGVEMLAVSSGEARSAREIPRATRIMFAWLAFVYVGAMAVLVGVMPWDRAGVSQSPFVTVFELARIPAASTLMNIVVLSAALSGANASLYVSSRMLFSLARGGYAPAAFGALTSSPGPPSRSAKPLLSRSAGWGGSGVPRAALLVSSFGILVAIALEWWAPESAYLYILGASLFGGMLAWWAALAAHVAFRRRLTPVETAALPLRAPGGALASLMAFVAVVLAIALTWPVPQSRITVVSGLPYLLVLTLAYWLWKKLRTNRVGK